MSSALNIPEMWKSVRSGSIAGSGSTSKRSALFAGTADSFIAEMADISFGGCRLVFNQRVPMPKGTELPITLNLPNEAFVSRLRALVVRIDRIKNSKATEVGLSFTGPQTEISKISNFCEFCMFFDME